MRNRIIPISIFFTFLFVMVCAMMPHAFAASHVLLTRAGGGESFGGGSFSGGSSFSGGFGGSSGFFFLPFFFGGNGGGLWIFFIIIFFLLPFILRRVRGGSWISSIEPQYENGNTDMNNLPEADLTPITANDPDFSKVRFLDKVQTAFFEIQNGWMKKDLSSIRGYMSDSLYQRFQTQIDDFNRRGISNVLAQVAVGNVRIVKVTVDANYQSIECAVLASMIDYKVNDASGQIVDGNKNNANQFTEYWIFTRSNKAKTKITDALITKSCPNCGAPLDINESGQCKYCKAYVLSGDFDWVLSEISQTYV